MYCIIQSVYYIIYYIILYTVYYTVYSLIQYLIILLAETQEKHVAVEIVVVVIQVVG